MTTKEIAQATGKAEKTVRTWIFNLAAESATIAAKLAASAPMKPADYTLAEVCDIIEAGLGKAAADVYRTNATVCEMNKKPAQYSAAYIREIRLTLGREAAAALLSGVIPAAPKPAQITDGRERLPDHIARQVYAVAAKAWEKEQAKVDARKSPSLFDK
jgi:hypothetical protein